MIETLDRNAILMCECRRVVLQGGYDGYCPYCRSSFIWRGTTFITLTGAWSVVGLLSELLGDRRATPEHV